MQHRYFAASNSAEGFKNYYPAVFARADRLFVIKGGPGTGKSGLMRRAAMTAKRKGYAEEQYFCSSDPESLDGVLIGTKDGYIGIIDGTPPHPWEPKHPGACEEILNLGQFWDSRLLQKQKNEILALSKKKSHAYNRAYDYLRSCGNLQKVTDALMRQAVDREKLRGAAERLVRLLSLQKGDLCELPALTAAVGMTGRVKLPSFEDNAETIYRIGDLYGVGAFFLSALREQLQDREEVLRLSFDPICPGHLDGIFLEQSKIAFLLSEKDESEEGNRFVNPKRFIDGEKLRELRSELRYAKKLYDGCLDGALHALNECKLYHFLLEDIYKNAMDFGALTGFTDSLLADLL